jgi:hypothetical protein
MRLLNLVVIFSVLVCAFLPSLSATANNLELELEESTIWPTPNAWNKGSGLIFINPFRFKITTWSEGDQIIENAAYPELLSKAIKRYKLLFFPENNIKPNNPKNNNVPPTPNKAAATTAAASPQNFILESFEGEVGFLSELRLEVQNLSENLNFNISERYTLIIAPQPSKGTWIAKIEAKNIYGAMWGLESFAQLLEPIIPQDQSLSNMYYITGVPMSIKDRPAYPWRLVLSLIHFTPTSSPSLSSSSSSSSPSLPPS